MTKILSTAALIFILTAALSTAEAAPNCKTGKPCGNSCIAQDKECHIAPPAAKVCKTGKPCGNTCIAQDKVCHQ